MQLSDSVVASPPMSVNSRGNVERKCNSISSGMQQAHITEDVASRTLSQTEYNREISTHPKCLFINFH